ITLSSVPMFTLFPYTTLFRSGGPDNVISLLELIEILESYTDLKIPVSFEEWRKGDQKYYVSDSRKFKKATGWKPQVSYKDGIERSEEHTSELQSRENLVCRLL